MTEQESHVATELERARTEITRLTRELEQERADNRRYTESERQEAVRSFAQQLGENLRHDVLNLKETEGLPPSVEQAKFLRAVVNGVVRRLKTAGVPTA